jgi:hypothetical protein
MARTTRLRLREAKTVTNDRGKTLCSAAQRERDMTAAVIRVSTNEPFDSVRPMYAALREGLGSLDR